MNWYYAENEERYGPVTEAEMSDLVALGRIHDDTLVWHAGMENWLPYAQVRPTLEPVVPEAASPPQPEPAGIPDAPPGPTEGPQHPEAQQESCAECGRFFPQSEMVPFRNDWVCADCKPVFFQKLKEGVAPAGQFRYAGFWIRVVAKIIDVIILQAVQYPLNLIINVDFDPTEGVPPGLWGVIILSWVLSTAVNVAYTTYFLGKFAATPGKMALGLKVIRANGDSVSYMRAFGRHFAEILSRMICLIGYIMAGFDDEKRTLHDRICDTRVVYK